MFTITTTQTAKPSRRVSYYFFFLRRFSLPFFLSLQLSPDFPPLLFSAFTLYNQRIPYGSSLTQLTSARTFTSNRYNEKCKRWTLYVYLLLLQYWYIYGYSKIFVLYLFFLPGWYSLLSPSE